MTRWDRVLIAVLAALALLSWPLAAVAGSGAAQRVVISAPGGETAVPLDTDRTLAVAGATGTVTVCVADGAVSVTDSGCPDQVCVRTGAVSAPGSVIACVPNRVVVRVEGGDDGGFDARIR